MKFRPRWYGAPGDRWRVSDARPVAGLKSGLTAERQANYTPCPEHTQKLPASKLGAIEPLSQFRINRLRGPSGREHRNHVP